MFFGTVTFTIGQSLTVFTLDRIQFDDVCQMVEMDVYVAYVAECQ